MFGKLVMCLEHLYEPASDTFCFLFFKTFLNVISYLEDILHKYVCELPSLELLAYFKNAKDIGRKLKEFCVKI